MPGSGSTHVPSFGATIRVGRLLEVWASRLSSLDDVTEFTRAFVDAGRGARRVIVCADYRGLAVTAPEVADSWLRAFRATNPLVERSAVMLALNQPIAHLQVSRLVREAASPARRVCHTNEEAIAWLSSVLTADELRRVEVFLTERR